MRKRNTKTTNRLRKLLTLLLDIFVICVSYYACAKGILPEGTLQNRQVLYFAALPVLVIIEILLFMINGLYTVQHKRFAAVMIELAVSQFGTFLLMMGLSYLIHQFAYSRVLLIIHGIISFILLCMWRHWSWRMDRKSQEIRDAIIVGDREECEHVYRRIKEHPLLDFNVKYVCLDHENVPWDKALHNIDVVILCSELPLKVKSEISRHAFLNGIQPILMPKTYEMIFRGMELDQIDDIPVFRPKNMHLSLDQRSMKRIVDIIVAGTAFVCFLPVMAAVAIAIKLKDPGPVIYSQMRVGVNNEEFRIYKFRTMKVDAEKLTGPVIAGEDDPRITPLGRFLRKVRLDELPQLWNVLKGDMSVVGPRPERKFFCDQFAQELPLYPERHNVKPGITGLAQVRGKYNTTAHDKLVYDLMYIQHYSLMNDFIIMVQTVKVMCTKSATEGILSDGEKLDLKELEI